MYRVTRSYRVTPRSKGVQFLRLGTTTWTNEAIDGYILGIYLCTCAYVMADRTRWIRMYRFALLRYAHSRREVRRILLDESKRESRTRRARAYYCLRYAFHRCWTRAFSLDTTTTTEKYVRTGIGVCWEGYAFSLSVKLPVVCFGNIFRFYLGSLLFKEIEKKRNGIHARKKIESEGRRTIALSFLHCSTAYGKSHDQERKKKR